MYLKMPTNPKNTFNPDIMPGILSKIFNYDINNIIAAALKNDIYDFNTKSANS